MAESAPVLALVSPEMRLVFEQRLAPAGMSLTFVQRVSELVFLIRKGQLFSVVILPASLPGGEIWEVWGELALLTQRPEVVIYAPAVTFELWSGVLDAGGHDVLAEPFNAQEVQETVLEAKRAFAERQTFEAMDKLS